MDGGSILKVDKVYGENASPPTILATGVYAVANGYIGGMDSSWAYFTNQMSNGAGEIVAVGLSGQGTATMGSCAAAGATEIQASGAVALLPGNANGSNVYWTCMDGDFYESSFLGNNLGGISNSSSLGNGNTSLTSYGTNVYYGEYNESLPQYPATVGSCSPNVGSWICEQTSTLTQIGSSVAQMASDGLNLYWTDYIGGSVYEIPVGGGATVQVGSGQTSPIPIAVGATYLYWGNSTTSTSWTRLPKGGGTPEPFLAGFYPSQLILDSSAIYMTNGYDKVYRVTCQSGP